MLSDAALIPRGPLQAGGFADPVYRLKCRWNLQLLQSLLESGVSQSGLLGEAAMPATTEAASVEKTRTMLKISTEMFS